MSDRPHVDREGQTAASADGPPANEDARSPASISLVTSQRRPSQTKARGVLAARLGQAMHQQRVRLGLTQEQLAERSALSSKYLGEIERGEANVTVEKLEQLARALNWDPWSLFDPSPQPIASNLHALLVGELSKQIETLESLKDVLTSLAPSARLRLSALPNVPTETRKPASKPR